MLRPRARRTGSGDHPDIEISHAFVRPRRVQSACSASMTTRAAPLKPLGRSRPEAIRRRRLRIIFPQDQSRRARSISACRSTARQTSDPAPSLVAFHRPSGCQRFDRPDVLTGLIAPASNLALPLHPCRERLPAEPLITARDLAMRSPTSRRTTAIGGAPNVVGARQRVAMIYDGR